MFIRFDTVLCSFLHFVWATDWSGRVCSYYAVVTCVVNLKKNYFSLRRHPSEIILFQHVETCLKLFQNYFAGLLQLVNIFEHVHCRWNNFEIISELLRWLKSFCFTCNHGITVIAVTEWCICVCVWWTDTPSFFRYSTSGQEPRQLNSRLLSLSCHIWGTSTEPAYRCGIFWCF